MRRQDLDPEGDDLTVNALALMAAVERRTVYLWITQKRFPKAYKLGKTWWIPQSDVIASLTEILSDTTG